MAAPTLTLTYPADNDVGIPVGISIELDFDRGIDLLTAEQNIVLYGRDFDITSGPDSAIWIDRHTGNNNPLYLTSPGFKGIVPLTYELVYLDGLGVELDPQPTDIIDEADEQARSYTAKIRLTPKAPLAPDVEYTLHVIGDTDGAGRGVSTRTVFDLIPDVGNTGTTGNITVYGSFEGSAADTINIEITTAGDIGVAKYKWWFSSAPAEVYNGLLTSRRYRKLVNSEGVQVRFSGSGFVLGDKWTIEVQPKQLMTTSTQVNFTTNDGSYSLPPTSPSTPAPAPVPGTVLPPAPGSPAAIAAGLQIIETDPIDTSYNNPLNTREITIVFSDDLDPATITQDTVRVYKMPVKGVFDGTKTQEELQKVLTVQGDSLIIEI